MTPKRVLAGFVVFFLLSSQLSTRAAGAISLWPYRLVHDLLVVPVSHPLHRLGLVLRGRGEAEPAADLEREEVAQLRREHDMLWQYSRGLEDELRRLRDENAMLRNVRGTDRDLRGKNFVPASVTGTPSRGGRVATLTINRGTSSGVGRDCIVIAGSGLGLVGHVIDAGPTGATVRLITSPGPGLGVRIVPPRPGPASRETLAVAQPDADAGGFYADIGKAEPVEVGDLAHVAEASRLEEARGYVLGRVEDKRDAPTDPTLRSRVTIRPLLSLAELDRVVVIVPVGGQNP